MLIKPVAARKICLCLTARWSFQTWSLWRLSHTGAAVVMRFKSAGNDWFARVRGRSKHSDREGSWGQGEVGLRSLVGLHHIYASTVFV